MFRLLTIFFVPHKHRRVLFPYTYFIPRCAWFLYYDITSAYRKGYKCT